jgi:hypothetical protein
LAFIGIKIVGLYKKYCWDMITIMVKARAGKTHNAIQQSVAIVIL